MSGGEYEVLSDRRCSIARQDGDPYRCGVCRSCRADEGPKLGCRVHELEVGTEFSMDEGRTWLVVRTEPQYAGEASDDLCFMASPAETTGLSAWERVQLADNRHVLLERHWSGNKKES